MSGTKTRLIKVGSDELVEEVIRLRLIYGKSSREIATALGVKMAKARELIIAATYYGIGLKDGLAK